MASSGDSSEFDIAIVGAGMVGSTLASLLARDCPGWRLALIDARPLPEEAYRPDYDHRATALAAGSVDMLARLGLWQRIGGHATAIRQVHVSDRGQPAGALIDAAEQGREALGYVLENAWLAPQLRAAAETAPGVSTFAPARVRSLSQGRRASRLLLDGGEVRARLVVLADGGASELPRQLGIEQQRHDYRQSALIANISLGKAHNGRAFERFTPDGPAALLPLDESPRGRRAALVWTRPPQTAERLYRADDAAFLAELQSAFGWRLGRLTRVGQRQCWPLVRLRAHEQVRSRLVLLGNSAHALHPVAGQGLNLSLRDAAELAACLHRSWNAGTDPGALAGLRAYLRRREADQALTAGLGEGLLSVFARRHPAWTALRQAGFVGLDWLPGLKAGFAAQTMGLPGGLPYE